MLHLGFVNNWDTESSVKWGQRCQISGSEAGQDNSWRPRWPGLGWDWKPLRAAAILFCLPPRIMSPPSLSMTRVGKHEITHITSLMMLYREIQCLEQISLWSDDNSVCPSSRWCWHQGCHLYWDRPLLLFWRQSLRTILFSLITEVKTIYWDTFKIRPWFDLQSCSEKYPRIQWAMFQRVYRVSKTHYRGCERPGDW